MSNKLEQSRSGPHIFHCVTQVCPGLTSTEANTLAKVLQADLNKFSHDTTALFSEANMHGRKVMYANGPSSSLGCDKLIQMEIERLSATSGGNCSDDVTVIDRDHLSTMSLV